MVKQMVEADLEEAHRDHFCRESGFRVMNFPDE
jgi:hypothetical protein